ncbi:MAG: IclR family transcriptional regulator [Rhodobacteraceae bacterium]|nr:IclR family transcriptional regulator [Paracoccaceae bacterium]MBR9823600.1 IclR family transcriptional regulator [Paracoccaceae bacterium]
MTKTEPDEGTDRQFVTALARGLDILGCFRANDRYLANQEIATRTGLAKPTVSRLTYTLTETGHLQKDPDSGEYRLSPKVLQLGFRVLSAVSLPERCQSELDALAKGPNPYVSIALAERSDIYAIYLAVSRSRQAVAITLGVGSRLPVFYTAIGRAILAVTDEESCEAALREGIQRYPDFRKEMEQSIVEARKDYANYGYCTSFGSWKSEVNAIATPVRSINDDAIYGLNIGGPSFLISADQLHRDYGERLLNVAGLLTSQP